MPARSAYREALPWAPCATVRRTESTSTRATPVSGRQKNGWPQSRCARADHPPTPRPSNCSSSKTWKVCTLKRPGADSCRRLTRGARLSTCKAAFAAAPQAVSEWSRTRPAPHPRGNGRPTPSAAPGSDVTHAAQGRRRPYEPHPSGPQPGAPKQPRAPSCAKERHAPSQRVRQEEGIARLPPLLSRTRQHRLFAQRSRRGGRLLFEAPRAWSESHRRGPAPTSPPLKKG